MSGNLKVKTQQEYDQIVQALFMQCMSLGAELSQQLPTKFVQDFIKGSKDLLDGKWDAQMMTRYTLEEIKNRKRDTRFLNRMLSRLLRCQQIYNDYDAERNQGNGLRQ